MRTILTLTFVLVMSLFSAAQPSQAASGAWAQTDYTKLRLVSQTDAVGSSPALTVGLHFQLNDHWKIYWRSPGDAGFPPSITLNGSTNAEDATIHWPLPERFSILGFETLGYIDEVVLPVTITVPNPGEAVSLRAQVSYLACAEICIPYDAEIALDLPPGATQGAAQPSAEAHLINRFETQVPKPGPAQGLDLDRVEFKPDGPKADTGELYVTASSDSGFVAPDVYIEGPELLAFAKPRVSYTPDGRMAVMAVPFEGLNALKEPFTDATLTLTLVDDAANAKRGAEFSGVQASPASADLLALVDAQTQALPTGPSMLVMLGLALLGGVILNLMPCVLPVLSIKLLSVVGHGGSDKRRVRLSFLASAAGIVTSFMVLAAALVALKGAGVAIGWGIQFQHPWFLVAMALVVTLFACNLWGFFEVHLPQAVAEIGAHETHVHGLGGHFMTGALATLLATPCSAPFLGTAVGFAMARGTFEILAIFAALGVGLALPYLTVALAPGLATRMPRPGKWMVTLRRVLGFALAATGVWLVSILAVQISDVAAALIAVVMVAIAVMLYAHKKLQRRYGRLDWIAVAVLAALAFSVPDNAGNGRNGQDADALQGVWQVFDQAAISQLIAQDKVVFVDVTADWCITCQVNKAAVMHLGAVFERLQSEGVVAMKADWTKPSDVISRYLASFGRYGIPFNAVYGPGAPNGIVLPELLTESIVMDAMDTAARKQP